ncbi:MAG TPA: cupin domain-containing protein [Kofleriaceae bacterium]|jgi:quercetin dioxygenase-like cupin family protein
MRTTAIVVTSLVAAAVLFAVTASADKDKAGFVRVTPEEVKWTERPGYDGVKFAVVQGDPSKPGVYVVRAKFSPGAMTRPHWHPEERFVTVLQGTWYTGEGDTFDPDKTTPLKPGSFMLHPAKAHHYDGAKDDEVIVQIIGIGPSATTLVHPEQGNTGRWTKK